MHEKKPYKSVSTGLAGIYTSPFEVEIFGERDIQILVDPPAFKEELKK
jgi:hypothetical protein